MEDGGLGGGGGRWTGSVETHILSPYCQPSLLPISGDGPLFWGLIGNFYFLF
jgi:hypothetical protein